MTQRKKLLVMGVLTGGLALLLILVLGKLLRHDSSAKPANSWSSSAVQSTFAGMQVREIDAAHAALVLFYDLDNKTDYDYRLANGANIVIMKRLKSDGSLSSEEEIKLQDSALVPAKNRTRIALEITRPFAWPGRKNPASESRFREFAAGEVATLDGFVLFDGAARYQIELRGAWQELEKIPTATGRN